MAGKPTGECEVILVNIAETFHLVADACRKTGSPGVLIGGFAVNFYKVTRQTADIDIMISEEGYRKIESILINAGFRRDFSDHVAIKLTGGASHLMDLDFVLVDDDTLRKMLKDGREAKIAGELFTVPSLNNLLALKLHSLKHNMKNRLLKDLPDIANLVKVNRVDFKGAQFKNLCQDYADEEIYRRLLDILE
jgi:hypothetical protein